MKHLHILIVFLFVTSINAQTTIFNHEEIYGNNLAKLGNELYFPTETHILKIDHTQTNPSAVQVLEIVADDLVFHGDELYFSSGSTISKIDVTDQSPTVVDVVTSGLNDVSGMAFKGDVLFIVDNSTENGLEVSDLFKIDVTGSGTTPTHVIDGPEAVLQGLAFHDDGNELYFISGSEFNNYKILKTDVSQSSPIHTEVFTEQNILLNTAFDGDDLYISMGHADIVKIDVTEDTPSSTFVVGISGVEKFIIDGAYLFIAAYDSATEIGSISKFKLPTIWDGADLSFAKTSGADWTLQTNQDRITDQVWITRQSDRPIYNYKWWQDTFTTDATGNDLKYEFFGDGEDGSTPTQSFTATGGTKGLRWAILDDTGASTDNWENFGLYGTLGSPTHFYSFNNVVIMIDQLEGEEVTINSVVDNFNISRTDASGTSNANRPNDFPSIVGKKLGVWIEDDNIYFTLTFNSWGSANGNFSYTRSTASTLSIDAPSTPTRIILLPNPVQEELHVLGITNTQHYTLYNLLGVAIASGTVSESTPIAVQQLNNGIYFLHLENGKTLKFIKT